MDDRPTVYIETTIPSYLTGRPANDLILAGKQEITRQWWEQRREQYRLVTSQFALDEAGLGDVEAAQRRLAILDECDILVVDGETRRLTDAIVATGAIPARALIDAAHIAVAARHAADYLLTWNCTHIANAEILRQIERAVAGAGYHLPIICIPDELFGKPLS